jgi:WD40 repeat protein
MLSVGDNRGKITVWDLESRQIISRLQAHKHNITSLQFSTNNLLYSSSGDDNHII